MPSTILIADHDPVQRRLLENLVRRFGYQAETAESGRAALARLRDRQSAPIALAIVDLSLPDGDGLSLLGHLRESRIATPIIVQSLPQTIEMIHPAMRAGAYDFLVKPVGAERLQISIKNALRLEALQDEARRAVGAAAQAVTFRHVFTRSESMERAIRLGERAARSPLPVLLEGEAGVGKQFFARAVHGASDRRGRPFVTFNCATSDEAALFGDGDAPGRLSDAQGGVLFIEDIGRASLDMQARLARVIQDGEIEASPSRRGAKVDVRIISATSQNLIERVRAGLFREDLYYRLNVFPIALPPLRARAADIGELARRFAQRFATDEGRALRGLSAEAMSLLEAYEWPGNVRQLENAVFRAVILCEGDELGVGEFPQIAARVSGVAIPAPPPAPAPPLRLTQPETFRFPLRDPHSVRMLDDSGHARRIEDIEAEAIRFALAHYRGQMSEMARRLGIGRSTLYRKLKDLGLQPETEVELEAPAPRDRVAAA